MKRGDCVARNAAIASITNGMPRLESPFLAMYHPANAVLHTLGNGKSCSGGIWMQGPEFLAASATSPKTWAIADTKKRVNARENGSSRFLTTVSALSAIARA